MYQGIIYKYTSPSKKLYIGQTRNEADRRYRWSNLNKPYAGIKIERARKKYGPENFQYEILFNIETENEHDLITILNQKEVEYILLYDSYNNGYNSSTGGDYFEQSRESVEKASESRKLPILQYDLQGRFVQEWKSAKDVELYVGIKACNIASVLKGKRYQAGGYIFKYKSAYEIPPTIKINPKKAQKQVILKCDLDDTIVSKFDSINSAARDCGVGRDCLRAYIDGKNNHIYKNFKWKRYEQT